MVKLALWNIHFSYKGQYIDNQRIKNPITVLVKKNDELAAPFCIFATV